MIEDVLCCPVCGGEDLTVRSVSATCGACARQYAVEHGVIDLAPPGGREERSVTQRIMESRFYARFYEDVMRPRLTHVVSDRTLPEEYHLAAKYLDLRDATAVLDVACGTGNFTRHFAHELRRQEPPALLVGVDISWPMLETARTYLRSERLEEAVHLVRANATRFPLRTGAFDRVHCAGALHMMEDIDAALAEFSRLLSPGGICVIGTFVMGRGVLRRAVKRLAEIPSGFHWFGPDELPGRLAAHGLATYAESVQGDALTIAARRVA